MSRYNFLIIFICCILLCTEFSFSLSTTNLGNVNIVGYLNVSNGSIETSNKNMSGYNITNINSISGNNAPIYSGSCTSTRSLTASNDLLICGKMEIDGTTYLDGAVILNNSMNMSGYNITNINSISGNNAPIYSGSCTSTRSLTSSNDLLVCGKTEHDGISYFDGTVSVGNTMTVADDTSFQFGTDGDSVIKYSTAQSYGDGLMITPPITSKNIIVTRYMNRNSNHFHPNNDNPTIYIHSGTNISQATSYEQEWMSFSSDNVSGVIDSGLSNVTISDNTVIEGNLQIGDRDVGSTSFEMYDDGTNIQINATTPKPFLFNSNITFSRPSSAVFTISSNSSCIFAINSTGGIKDIMCNGG